MTNTFESGRHGCIYEIDSDDRIVFCDEGWDSFATENNGELLSFESIEGRLIWEFFGDPSTIDLYRRLVAYARRGNQIRFEFRCDSPKMIQLFEMRISSTDLDRIRFATQIETSELRKIGPIEIPVSQAMSEPLVICSWCSRMNVGKGSWKEVDVAVEMVKMFDSPDMPQISHGICPDCRENISGMLPRRNLCASIVIADVS